jgi:hypothetical protein
VPSRISHLASRTLTRAQSRNKHKKQRRNLESAGSWSHSLVTCEFYGIVSTHHTDAFFRYLLFPSLHPGHNDVPTQQLKKTNTTRLRAKYQYVENLEMTLRKTSNETKTSGYKSSTNVGFQTLNLFNNQQQKTQSNHLLQPTPNQRRRRE